jgi:hypothetical protein
MKAEADIDRQVVHLPAGAADPTGVEHDAAIAILALIHQLLCAAVRPPVVAGLAVGHQIVIRKLDQDAKQLLFLDAAIGRYVRVLAFPDALVAGEQGNVLANGVHWKSRKSGDSLPISAPVAVLEARTK